ncbi:metal-dependent hydrolase [Haloterrigena sp. H1]|uniref:metal-dependent hydrolase n=1 Tax=Haloterrigena sp. H1 TaxID=2552943 RepID=UPI00110D5BFE|nr:metal-dependent hydrolase [Haloterrigena sp. H1]TMT85760.1 metal-dependent hydrolase [Haloterrigena sp. H1]
MWPWEHLAFAYALYSVTRNVGFRTSPSARETIAVAVGSQFPDLVDKPLGWTFGFAESGYSIGHSIFVAPAVCLVAYAVAARWGNRALAGAFSLAYLSHPIGDMLSHLFRDGTVDSRIVLWPIASPPATDYGGFLDHLILYLARYVYHLLAGGVTPQIVVQSLLGLAVVALWLSDGAPPAADIWRFLRTRSRQ